MPSSPPLSPRRSLVVCASRLTLDFSPVRLLPRPQQSASHAYPSIPAALKHIVRSEGVSGLYAGLQAKLLQSVLTAALLFAGQQRVYEAVKRALVKV